MITNIAFIFLQIFWGILAKYDNLFKAFYVHPRQLKSTRNGFGTMPNIIRTVELNFEIRFRFISCDLLGYRSLKNTHLS